ncbi:MAG: GNAT family N-acetyltransferase [Spirochaetales bacterium]|jgi:GNAT superfamily N-acetyltransferase|nr:GNAT family N-acetyltransferase [Spirochaetales bacterium]
MLNIQPVTTKREWKAFYAFPDILYADNPYYVPAIKMDEKGMFDPKKNPALEYVETIAYLAYRDGKVVGRIAALINHKLNGMKERKYIRFNRWDVIDDFAVSKALFEAIIAWGQERGMENMIGPIGFSDLDKQGLLVEGFDQMSMIITLYNHPYYADHLEALGFAKDVDWLEYKVFVPKEIDPRVERISTIAQKRHGYRLLEFTHKKQVIPYAIDMFHMYNESFSDLYGFCPLTDAQIDQAVDQFFALVSLDYIYVVVDAEDKVIGFGIMAPSFSDAIKRSKGQIFPFGILRLLKAMRHHTVLDMYLIAVKPEYFGRGVAAVIMNEGIKQAIANGVEYAETGPELEHNDNVRTLWAGFKTEQHKRRRCYIKSI